MILLNGDCLSVLGNISDNSIDLIFCDLPYGALPKQEWDKKIDLDKLWVELLRVRKDSHTPNLFMSFMRNFLFTTKQSILISGISLNLNLL